MAVIQVSVAQHACSENVDKNIACYSKLVAEAAAQGSQLIALQELHNSRYFCQTENESYFDLASPIPGKDSDLLAYLAQTHNITISGSLFEARGHGVYHNTAVVCEPGTGLSGRYRKMHIPDDPGYYEKYYFTPGDLGFIPIDTALCKLGVLICWDQWFPEAARLVTLSGAEIVIYPTAIGWAPNDSPAIKQQQLDAWITVLRANAISNGVYVLAPNRCGFEPDPSGQTAGIEFWGNSLIIGPQGEIIAQAQAAETTLLTAAIDTRHSETVRRQWPYLRDRRIDAYAGLNARYLD